MMTADATIDPARTTKRVVTINHATHGRRVFDVAYMPGRRVRCCGQIIDVPGRLNDPVWSDEHGDIHARSYQCGTCGTRYSVDADYRERPDRVWREVPN